jgi:hypothetical protein
MHRVTRDPPRVRSVPRAIGHFRARGSSSSRRNDQRLDIHRDFRIIQPLIAGMPTAQRSSASSRMSANTGDDVRAVAAEIVRYLRAHPEAADTVEGAARWWLRHEPREETIAQAMTMLVDQRIVEKYTLPEGTTVFRGGPCLASREPSDDP